MDDPTGQATPIPIKTSSQVDPTWTAGTSGDAGVSEQLPVAPTQASAPQPPASAPAEPVVAPPPSVPEPIPANDTVAAELSKDGMAFQDPTVPVPVSNPTIPDPNLPPQTPPADNDLAVNPPPKPPRQFPWKPVLIVVGVLVILGGVAGVLYWQGILFGAPRDPKVALTKMGTALANINGFHESGTFTVTFNPPNNDVTLTPTVTTSPTVTPTATAHSSPPCAPSANPTVTPSPPCAPSASSTSAANSSTSPSASPTVSATPTPTLTTPAVPTTSTGASQPIVVTGTMILDQASKTNGKVALHLDLSQLPSSILPATLPTSIDAEIRLADGKIYLQMPLLALVSNIKTTEWVELPATTTASVSTATKVLDAQKLLDAITQSQRVGYDQLGPVRAAHYQLTLDTTKLLAATDGSSSLSALSTGLTEPAPIKADIWLGVHDMLPYKMQFSLGDSSKDLFALAYTANLTQYNGVAAVPAPDPSLINAQGIGNIDVANLDSTLQEKARDAQRKTDLRSMKSALMLYKTDHGKYPSSDGKVVKTNDAKNVLQDLVSKGYLSKLPVDPNDPKTWYGYKSDGTTFELWGALEDKTDPDGQQQGAYFIFKLTNDPSAKDVQNQTTTTQTNLPAPTASTTPSAAATDTTRLPS